MLKFAAAVLAMVAACSESPPEAAARPSCDEAIDTFHVAGCDYSEPGTLPPVPNTRDESIDLCQRMIARAEATKGREECVDELEAWLDCNNDIAQARSSQCCNIAYVDLVNCLPQSAR